MSGQPLAEPEILAAPAGSLLQGRIDAVENGRIFGWAWNPASNDERVEIRVKRAGITLVTTRADKPRIDLRRNGIGDGAHAFDLELSDYAASALDRLTVVAVEEATGTTLELKLPAVAAAPEAAPPSTPMDAVIDRLDLVMAAARQLIGRQREAERLLTELRAAASPEGAAGAEMLRAVEQGQARLDARFAEFEAFILRQDTTLAALDQRIEDVARRNVGAVRGHLLLLAAGVGLIVGIIATAGLTLWKPEPLAVPADAASVIVAEVDAGLLLIAGTSTVPVPATLDFALDGRAGPAKAAAVTWRRAGEGAPHGFAAAIPLPAPVKGKIATIGLRVPGRPFRLALREPPVPVEMLARAVLADCGGTAAVIDGILEFLLARDAGPARLKAVMACVRAAAVGAGFVELVGRSGPQELFLQGWAADLPAGRLRVLVGADAPLLADYAGARFERADIADRGHGFAGLIRTPRPLAPGALAQIFYRTREGWRALDVYERRVLIEARDTPAHVRAVLPKSAGPEESLNRLRAAAQRFDGRDTISGLDRPVRIGIDYALLVPGGSVLICGWLLDPERQVRAMRLHAGGEPAVLSDGWSRQARPDVTAAFAANPLFAAMPPGRHGHGFLAFASRAARAPDRDTHVELLLADGATVHQPLALTALGTREAVNRALAALDPRWATTAAVIERQLGPLITGAPKRGRREADALDIGFDDNAGTALVIGADMRLAEAGTLLALLALDPTTRSVPTVLAAPAEAFLEAGSELRRLAEFYRLPIRLVPAEGIDDHWDAMEAGIAATRARTLVLLSAAVLPGQTGWLPRLVKTHRDHGERAMVSPSILFEDGSIRWAGSWIEGDGSGKALVSRYLGYPRAVLADAEPGEVAAGTLDCCVLSRAAFESAGGFAPGYLGTAEKGADMALRIRLAGTPAVWQPDVEMLSADDPGAGTPAAQALARRLDRWAFTRRWSLALANLRS